ncbi:AIM9 (YER080W) [Zygosaccharomyces parabailii]|nr:AIM9 (YER080W) [Zygosaccharomyces parabailii]CDH13493.1 probable Altered inheritance of mitochondria protein 9, mitochondrial [Zygosaccharomyces bailii ISA1307]
MIRSTSAKLTRRLTSLRTSARSPLRPLTAIRPIGGKTNEVFTKLNDEGDPKRDAFFNYSWGSWLINDKQEKAKRVTKFSIEGLTDILNQVYAESQMMAKSDKSASIPSPSHKSNLTVTLPHNTIIKNVGTVNPNEKVRVLRMASIHEGKHHRIYKLDTNLDKSFVLRIPYGLENEHVLAQRLKSEVATMDFASLKLGLNIPKVFCYGANYSNPIRQPFILQEYVEGKLLMRDWNPLVEDKKDSLPDDTLKKVVEQVSNLQSKLISQELNGFGSLYFASDFELPSESPKTVYDGEVNPELRERWTIGPSVERCFWRKKAALSYDTLRTFSGPWPVNSPLDIVKNTGLVEAENAKARLALKQADASPEAVDETILREQIVTFDNLATVAPYLFNSDTTTIPNVKELLKPRLYHPDLDPMNVIITADGTPYLLDFEGASIKPFILHSSPHFVAYDGPKIYDVNEDVPDYEKLSEEERAQYDFMYKRTRNQYLWEAALNERSKQLISAVAPPVKLLRSPYIAAIEMKSDQEYLLVDEALIQLSEVWDVFAKNGLVKSSKFPIELSKEQVEKHSNDLNAFHEKLITRPFAATQGWIPQDMFDNLVKAGVLVQGKDGNYSIKREDLSEDN